MPILIALARIGSDASAMGALKVGRTQSGLLWLSALGLGVISIVLIGSLLVGVFF